jgi:peroxiredoxin
MPSQAEKRNLRVVKWLGTTPAAGVCTVCNREFTVPLTVLKSVADAQERLRVQFAEHKCKQGDSNAIQRQSDFPLPPGLPKPLDDGAANHLKGMSVPRVFLPSTRGRMVDLSALSAPRTVLYSYPMTGVPGKRLPEGWDMIPGARGCTPQACSFRNNHQELSGLRTEVYGLSTQTTEYQREMADRLHLPFEILSDADFKLCEALDLPTFEVDGARLVKRMTLIVRDGLIEHVFYPVFPPNESADQVIGWLKVHPIQT